MAMTLEKAIEHAREVAENENCGEECCEQHRQLAEWLEELQQYKNGAPEVSMSGREAVANLFR